MCQSFEILSGIYPFFFSLSDAPPFSRYWQSSYSQRDEISFSKIELNQSSTAASINQRQLRCVNGARAPHSRRLVSSFTRRRWSRSLHGSTPSSTPVCSRQRVITIASQHEPTAESRSATRGSFNIDNNPRAGSPRFSLPLSPASPPLFRFLFSRVSPRYSASSLLADYYRRAVLD